MSTTRFQSILFTQPMNDLPRPGLEQTGMGEIAHNLLTGTLRRTTKTDVPRGEGRKKGREEHHRETKEVHHTAHARAPPIKRLISVVSGQKRVAREGLRMADLRVNFRRDVKSSCLKRQTRTPYSLERQVVISVS